MDDYHYDRVLRSHGVFGSEEHAILLEALVFHDETLDTFYETILEPGKILQSILTQKQYENPQPIAGLRVLICPDRNIEKNSKLPGPTNETTVNAIPLDRRTFEAVLREFKIPKAFLKIHSRRTAAFYTDFSVIEHGEFLGSSMETSERHQHPQSLGFVHQTDSNTKAFFSIAGSYCPDTGISSILLCGLHEKHDEIDELRRRLRYSLRRAPAPFLVSTLLLDMRFEYLERRIDEVHRSLHRTKYILGIDSTISLPSHAAPDTEKANLDLADVSRDVTKAISTAASKVYGCEAHMNMTPHILKAAEICLQVTPDSRKPWCSAATVAVRSRLTYHRTWLATMRARTQYLLQRAQGYAQTIYNLSSHRDNTLNLKMARISNSISSDSKAMAHAAARDSTAMKSIALVTTLFLPATFTATLFSTSFFDFKAEEHSEIVSKHVWVYFLVTCLLTFIILCVGYPLYVTSLRKGQSEVKSRERKAETETLKDV